MHIVKHRTARCAAIVGFLFAAAMAGRCCGEEPAPPQSPLPVQPEHATNRAGPTDGPQASPLPWSLAVAGCALIVLGLAKGWQHAARPRSLGEAPAVRIVGRTALGTRHALYVVRVGSQSYLVGTGSQGPPALLGRVDGATDFATSRDMAAQVEGGGE
jgi:anti-sigma factor RsiW